MSHKATAFTIGNPVPKTQSRFVVYIPEIYDSPIRVWSSKVPQSSLSVVPLPVAGQTINLPGKEQYSGQWECKLYESAALDVAQQVALLKQKTWVEGTYIPIEPIVMLTDEFTGLVPMKIDVLKGAFIEQIAETELDWARPGVALSWSIRFRYTKINPLQLTTDVAKNVIQKIGSKLSFASLGI